MDLGIELPHLGAQASAESITRIAQGAEALGYGCVWVGERLLYPTNPRNGYGNMAGLAWPPSQRVAYDPLETLSYVAAKTDRIRLGASVLTVLFQPPVILAKRLATLDQLSGGRVIAGLGQGWSEDEFITSGVPISRRGRGFEEYLEALRRVWGPDPVEFSGRFYQIPESYIAPKPAQPDGPPILIGAVSPPSLMRAVRMADGITPIALRWDQLEQTVAGFREAARSAGRDPASLPIMVRSNNPVTPRPSPQETRLPLGGSVEQVGEDMRRLEALGVSHVFFGLSNEGMAIDEQLRLMERLRVVA